MGHGRGHRPPRGGTTQGGSDRDRENPDGRDRLSQAGLRINEGLVLDTVFQQVADSARALTGSRYGVITAAGGRTLEFVTFSGRGD